ncbi:response regulator [Amycolatopsis sp. NPDC058986]|uniref:response regulator transcription factor n=1 Tax=unclassified Amycolatopsis TaxID=2618356 RepID=UPI00366C5BA5
MSRDDRARISVMVVDDHPLWRSALAARLADHGFDVEAEASEVDEAIQTAQRIRPTIVVLDLHLGRTSGVEASRDILRALPATKILMLTTTSDEAELADVRRSGAAGHVAKTAAAADLAAAVEKIVTGSPVTRPPHDVKSGEVDNTPPAVAPRITTLTERENEVLRMVVEGDTTRQIAEKLVLSPRTVDNHVQSILHKVGVRNRTELATYAAKNGLLAE